MPALHHVGLIHHHVVAQIVKAELVVGAVGDIGCIGGPAGVVVGAFMGHKAHGKAQKTIGFAHPLTVAAGQIIVYGNHVYALAGKGIQIHGQCGHQRFAFTGLHFGNAAAVQRNAANDLHREGLHAQHAPVSFAANGKSFGQKIVQRFALGQTLAEFTGFGLQLIIGKRGHGFIQRQHLVGDGADLLQLLVGKSTKNLVN